jgi:hypothetical protein
MYKITAVFKSNVKNVYTQEVEIATDEIQKTRKYDRMLNRWFNILCPYVDYHKLRDYYSKYLNSNGEVYHKELNHLIKRFIDNSLDTLNMINDENIENGIDNQREFSITIEEYNI